LADPVDHPPLAAYKAADKLLAPYLGPKHPIREDLARLIREREAARKP
jgi:hypothetical protein